MNNLPFEDPALDEEIARVYLHLQQFSAEDEEYRNAVDQLSKLYKLKSEHNKLKLELQMHNHKHSLEVQQMENAQAELAKSSFFTRVSPDAVLAVAGNLAIALIVVKYEQTGVISSQVRNFIKKI